MRQHYETFAAEVDHASGVTGLPQFVKDEFDAYLKLNSTVFRAHFRAWRPRIRF